MLRNLSKLVCLLCILASVVEGRRDFKEKIKKCFSHFFPEKPTPPPPPPVSCPCNEFSTLESLLNQDGVVIDRERSCKTSSDASSGEVFGIFADPPAGSGFPPLTYAVSFDRLTCQSIDAFQSLSSKAEADACKDVLVETCESLPLPPPVTCPCNEFFTLSTFLTQDDVTIDRERSCKTIVGGSGDDVEFGIFGNLPAGSGFPPLSYVVSFDSLTCLSIDAVQSLSSKAEADACKDLLVETCDALPPPCPCKSFNKLDDILDKKRGVAIDKEVSCVARDEVDDFFLEIRASDPDGLQPNFSVSSNNNEFSCGQFDAFDFNLSQEEFNVCKDLLEDKCDRLNLPPASCPCTNFSTLSSVLQQDGVVIDRESSCQTFFDFDTGDDFEFGIFADPPPGSAFPPLDYVVSFDRLTCQSLDAVTFLSRRAEAVACKDDLVDTCRKLNIFPPGSCPCDFSGVSERLMQPDAKIDFEKSCKVTNDPLNGGESLGIFAGPAPPIVPFPGSALNYEVNFDLMSCNRLDAVIGDLSPTQLDACKHDLFESCMELKIPTQPTPPTPSVSCPCEFSDILVDRLTQERIGIDFQKSCIFKTNTFGEERLGIFAFTSNSNTFDALNYELFIDGRSCSFEDNPEIFDLSNEQVDACTNDLLESCVELRVPSPPRPPVSCPCDFIDGLAAFLTRENLEPEKDGSCDFTGSDVRIRVNQAGESRDFSLDSDLMTCTTEGDQVIGFNLSTRRIDACKNDLLESCIELKIPTKPASCPCGFSNDLVDTLSQDAIIDFDKSCKFDNSDRDFEKLGIFGGDLNGNDLSYQLNIDGKFCSTERNGNEPEFIDLSDEQVDACTNDLLKSCVELEIPTPPRPPAICPCDFTNRLLDTFTSDFIFTEFENSCIFTDDPTGTVGVRGGNGRDNLSYILGFDPMGGSCVEVDAVRGPFSTRKADACKKDLKESCDILGIPASCPCNFTNDLLDTLRQYGIDIDREKSCKFTTDPADNREEFLGIFATDQKGNALNYDLAIDSRICGFNRDNPDSINLSSEQIVNACTKDLLESCAELGIPTPPRPLPSCPCDFSNGLRETFMQNGIDIDFQKSCEFPSNPSGSSIGIFAANGGPSYTLDFLSTTDVLCTAQSDAVSSNLLTTQRVDVCRNELMLSCLILNIPILEDGFGSVRSEL